MTLLFFEIIIVVVVVDMIQITSDTSVRNNVVTVEEIKYKGAKTVHLTWPTPPFPLAENYRVLKHQLFTSHV